MNRDGNNQSTLNRDGNDQSTLNRHAGVWEAAATRHPSVQYEETVNVQSACYPLSRIPAFFGNQ